MSRYMLDTDTASYLIRGGYPALDRRVAATPPDDLSISVVTRAELLYGVRRKPEASHLARMVDQLLGRVRSLAWDDAAADRFASLASSLTAMGQPIGTFDAMIAAHALARGAILVTNNLGQFGRVPDLVIENWVSAEPPG